MGVEGRMLIHFVLFTPTLYHIRLLVFVGCFHFHKFRHILFALLLWRHGAGPILYTARRILSLWLLPARSNGASDRLQYTEVLTEAYKELSASLEVSAGPNSCLQ